MKKTRLTIAAIDRIKSPKEGRSEHFDTEIPGLLLRVTPTGVKSWSFQYRVRGKKRRLTLGQYPGVTLKAARSDARDAYHALQNGNDPILLKKRAERTLTDNSFKAVAQQYIEKRRKRRTRNRTWERSESILMKSAEALHGIPIQEIDKPMVADLLDTTYDNRGPYAANALYAQLSALMNWALGRDLIAALPIHKSMKPHEAKPRNNPLSKADLKDVWKAADKEGYPYGHLIKCCILTLQRSGTSNKPGEIAGLQWPEIDKKKREWTLPDERCKSGKGHALPLTDMMIGFFESFPALDGPCAFSADMGKTPFNGFSRAKARLDERIKTAPGKRAKVSDWMVKDLRETGATVMRRDLGVPDHVVGMVLNHAPSTVTTRHYASQHDMTAKRDALESWCRYLQDVIS